MLWIALVIAAVGVFALVAFYDYLYHHPLVWIGFLCGAGIVLGVHSFFA